MSVKSKNLVFLKKIVLANNLNPGTFKLFYAHCKEYQRVTARLGNFNVSPLNFYKNSTTL
jgi:hypothetical protein